MKLGATITSERGKPVTKTGNERLEISINDENKEILSLYIIPDFPYSRISVYVTGKGNIGTFYVPTKSIGNLKHGKDPTCKHGVNLKYDDCLNCDKGQ